MKKNIKKENDFVEICISAPRKIGKATPHIVISPEKARELILEEIPEIKIQELPENIVLLDNKNKDMCEECWKFHIIKEQKKEEPKKQVEKKVSKKTKNILNFKPKSDTVVETTEPEADQAKGVQEPTE
jgi:hypothetical protein